MNKIMFLRRVRRPRRSSSSKESVRTFLLTLASLVGFVVIWQIVGSSAIFDSRIFPNPITVAVAFWTDWASGNLIRHLHTSSLEFFWGYFISVLIGIPVGLFLGANRLWELSASPYLLAMYSTPSQAWQPLLIMWFGLGFQSQVLLVFLFSFFVIVLNVSAGVKSVDPILLRVARSYQASRFETFVKIVIPASIPYIMTGLRLGVGRAAIGVFLAEFFGASSGLGFYIVRAGTAYQMDRVFVGVLILIFLSYLLTESIRLLEDRMTAWRL